MSEFDYGTLIDASDESKLAVTLPTKKAIETSEVLELVMGYDDIIGRMPVGFDPSDFDLIPRDRVYDTPNMTEGAAGDELDLLAGEEPQVFRSPEPEQFPLVKQALRNFAAESAPKVVRIDTEKTYGDFVCEKAVAELDRRITALENALHAHMDDDHAHHVDRVMKALEDHISDPYAHKSRLVRGIKNAEILGAAEAISDLRNATSPEAAVDAMPQVPVDLPEFAEGKVKCWKDGEHVICSMRFEGKDGKALVATMASRPQVDEEAVESWAVNSGVSPDIILGILPDLADVRCGKRLVRDTARAAMQAREHEDVLGIHRSSEPALLVNRGNSASAPIAALMSVQQRADAGDRQARDEMAKIRIAAQTQTGRLVAAPLLDEADRRLAAARSEEAKKDTFANRYALMGGCL